MALVCSEIYTANFLQRSLWSFWAEIEPHFTLRLKEQPRPPYAHRDFDKLRVDLPELGNGAELGQNHDAFETVSATL